MCIGKLCLRGWIALSLCAGVANAADVVELRKEQQLKQRIERAARLDNALGLSAQDSLEIAQSRTGPRGVRHVRYRQTFRGVPIWGEAVVVSRNATGDVKYVHGRIVRNIARDITSIVPRLSAQEALNAMKNATLANRSDATKLEYKNESSDLVIFMDGEAPRLSYAVTFFADKQGGGAPTRPVFLVDAHTGQILFEYEGLTHVELGTGPGGNEKTGLYRYDGTLGNFSKMDVQQVGSTCTMNNADVKTVDLNHGTEGTTAFAYTCPENTHKQINGAYSPLNDAHSFGGVVFDMYSDWMASAPLTQQLTMRVHYGSNYDNAFWDGSSMTFGDGNTKFYPLVSLDVAAHEVSHGFTEQNSDLIYSGQSGGINEAFSDIAGEAAEFYSRGSNDFLMGADITKQTQALRYMADPTLDGFSIGHADDYYYGLDVHYSSGVYNKAFYLLANTAGWDVHKAFVLFATANRDIWTPSETFDSAYAGLLTAYGYLPGTGGYPDYTGTDISDIQAAFAQVGVPRPPPNPACQDNPPSLSNGVSTGTFSATVGEWKCWKLAVPANAADLNVRLRNRVKGRNKYSGDADLYIRHGSSPRVHADSPFGGTPEGEFDCGSYGPRSDEECNIPDANNPEPPTEGDWYIAVFAWSDYPAVNLTGTYALEGDPPEPTSIELSAVVKGGRKQAVHLSWSGASGSTVDVKRNGFLWANTPNDGSQKDSGGQAGNVYQVCETGSTTCSQEVVAQ